MLNKLLERQVQTHLGGMAKLSEAFADFINSINGAFNAYDDKIASLENCVKDCTTELGGLNKKLLRETAGLKMANDELSRIFNQVNEGFFTRDMIAGRYIQMSVGCEKIYGYPTKDFFANPQLWRQVIHPDDTILIDGNSGMLQKGEQVKTSYRIIHKDGGIRWIEVKIIPALLKGKLVRLDGVVNDITERKEAEILLKDSELKYRSFFENNMDGVLLSKPNDVILKANPAACEIFRLSEEKICGYSHAELMSFSEPVFATLMEERNRTGKFRGEFNFIRPDGSTFMAEIASGLFKGASGEDRSFVIVRDITVRKNAQAQVLMNERQLDLIYNSITDSIFMLAIEKGNRFRFVSVNHSFLKATGLRKEQVAGKYVDEVIPSPSLELALLKYQEALAAKKTVSWEEQTTYPSGIKTGMVSINPVLDESGNCIRIIGSIHDITERRLAEKNIRESMERFQRLSQATHDAIWDWNLITDEVWWNEGFFKMLGYDVNLPIPATQEWTKKIHPDDRQKVIERLGQVRKNMVAFWEHEFRYELEDGRYGTVLDRAYVLRDDSGKPNRVIGAIMDITERKKTERQIADSEQRYRQIVETAQEGIWMMDQDFRAVFANKKMCEIFEYSLEEIMGKHILDFMDEERKCSAKLIMQSIQQGVTENFDFYFITKTGKHIWANLCASSMLDINGECTGVLAMVTDITKRKLSEEMLQKSEADLDLKNKELERKNKELEQFAYVASHDLQEPLRTTSSFVQLIKQQYAGRLDEKADKYLSHIVDSSNRMKILIKDLLDYSRIGSNHKPEQVNCNKILQHVTADLDKAISDSAAEIISGDLPIISGYPTDIKQLFQNLLINAIKFSKKNVPPKIKISVERTGANWDFSFADNGIGIEQEHSERIFIIFQRLHTRNEYEGSGIGLSHCKKIVELHHGKIWVEGAPGEGSVFHFTIPAMEGMQAMKTAAN